MDYSHLCTIFLQSGLFEGIADGLNNAKVMLAFVSDEYAESQNCVMEFRFATSILKIPTILAVVWTSLESNRGIRGFFQIKFPA